MKTRVQHENETMNEWNKDIFFLICKSLPYFVTISVKNGTTYNTVHFCYIM